MIINLVDYQGNPMGTLTLPDGTSQDVVNEHLAMFAAPPQPISVATIIKTAVESASDFGAEIMSQFEVQNVEAGITQAGATQTVADYCVNLFYYMNSGSLYAAMNEINRMIADTSQDKTNVSPYITNDVLYKYLNLIQTYLCIALTQNPGSGS